MLNIKGTHEAALILEVTPNRIRQIIGSMSDYDIDLLGITKLRCGWIIPTASIEAIRNHLGR